MFKLRSKLEIKLLSYFFMNPEKEEYLLELARILDVDPGNLDKKLKKLEKTGLFESEIKGKQKYYSLNRQFSLYKEYKSIVNKTYGIENRIKQTLKEVKNVEEAYIFGSYVKEKLDKYSDIDLLIIGDFDTLTVSKKLVEIEKDLGRDINTVEMTKKEFETKKHNKNDLVLNIFSGKTIKLL